MSTPDHVDLSAFSPTEEDMRAVSSSRMRRRSIGGVVLSALRLLGRSARSLRVMLARLDPAVQIGSGTLFARGVSLEATDGGTIVLGRNVWIGRDVRLVARRGQILIGDNTHIGDGALIAASEHVRIGSDALIAEYVVIRDQDHAVSHKGHKHWGGELVSPIVIGDDVWIGTKATVLRNVRVGSCALIGAHSLVRDDVPPFCLAVGVPAVIKGQITPNGLKAMLQD